MAATGKTIGSGFKRDFFGVVTFFERGFGEFRFEERNRRIEIGSESVHFWNNFSLGWMI